MTEENNITLNQLENEKQSKKNLELKFSELQVRSAEKSKNWRIRKPFESKRIRNIKS